MLRPLARIALVLALVPTFALAAGVELAPGPDVHFVGPDGQLVRGVRCATPTPSREEMAAVEATLEGLGLFGEINCGSLPGVVIPVQWHVVRSGTSISQG
ncbi:MAG: hypothetical protein H6Q03_1785, partial [Acidobacteria bacterium]|nr:hypothetical protein [Acidobacteriota bacterium]